jgi:diacylglycerol kinase
MYDDKEYKKLLNNPEYNYEILDEVLKLQKQMEIAVAIMAMLVAFLFLLMALKISPYFLAGSVICCMAMSNVFTRNVSKKVFARYYEED